MARQIASPRFALAEQKRNVFRCVPEIGTTLAEILEPTYFANVNNGGRIRPGDLIEVLAEDVSGLVVLMVRKVEHASILCVVLENYNFDEDLPEVEAPPAEYRVEHAGEHIQWRVVRVADSATLKDGIASKRAASTWLTNHLKSAR